MQFLQNKYFLSEVCNQHMMHDPNVAFQIMGGGGGICPGGIFPGSMCPRGYMSRG